MNDSCWCLYWSLGSADGNAVAGSALSYVVVVVVAVVVDVVVVAVINNWLPEFHCDWKIRPLHISASWSL